MRVTMVNKHYPPHLGGIEYHLRDLAEALATRGHEVRAVVANEGPERVSETLGGVEVLRLPRIFAVSSAPVAPALARELAAVGRRTDLVHLHFPYPWGELSWLRARPRRADGSRVPAVVTYHSDIVRQRAMLAAYAPLLRRFLREVDLVVASSPDMVEHSPFLARVRGKCRVVPFGIRVEAFEPTPELERRAEELRARHERPIVLFVGRLIYYKGADVLVRAMAGVDADLVVVGKGPLEAELRTIAMARGVAGRVTFLPPVDDAELRAWYRAADVFCLPSVARSEAFGLVQLEAHASGTPVVSTRLTTGVPFVNADGVTGLTVPPGDVEALAGALRRLIEDRALRERLGAQARERARREFTIARMVDDTLAVYGEAVALGPRADVSGGEA